MYHWEPTHQISAWSVQSVWTLPDYKDFIPKSQFPQFCPKMTPHRDKNLWTLPDYKESQNHNFPKGQKSIGFIYVSLGTHTPNLSLIGPVSLDFAWLQGFYPKITISPILPKNDPPSGQKSIGFIYVSLGTHTPNFSLIGPVSLDFAWLQGFYPKITISPILPKNDPPSGQKSIGFIYVSLGTHIQNFRLIGPVRLDLAWLQGRRHTHPPSTIHHPSIHPSTIHTPPWLQRFIGFHHNESFNGGVKAEYDLTPWVTS